MDQSTPDESMAAGAHPNGASWPVLAFDRGRETARQGVHANVGQVRWAQGPQRETEGLERTPQFTLAIGLRVGDFEDTKMPAGKDEAASVVESGW